MQRSLPPAEISVEKAVIGALFESADSHLKLKERGAVEGWFTHPDLRSIWRKCDEGATEGKQLDDVLFLASLGHFSLVDECRDECVHVLNLPVWADHLKHAYLRRASLDNYEALGKLITDPEITPLDISNRLSELNKALGTAFGKNGLPPFKDMSRAFKEIVKKPDQVIKGMLYRGAKLALGGNSKGFKTWTLIAMGLAVATGRKWLQFETSKTKVLYLNFELFECDFDDRVRDVSKYLGIDGLPAGEFVAWNLRGEAVGYREMLPKIAEAARTHGFGLIIVDPTYKFYGDDVDENKAGDIARMMNAFETLARDTGAAIAMGTHFSKGNQASKDPMDRISGSGVFGRDPDAILTFTKHRKKDHLTVDITVRSFAPIESFVVLWQCPHMSLAEGESPDDLKTEKSAAVGRPAKGTTQDVLDLLSEPLLTRDWQKKAEEELKISRSSFYGAKGELEEAGSVSLDPRTKKWERTYNLS